MRADLTPTVSAHVIDLGMGVTGSPKWQVEFGRAADCTLTPATIKPRVTHLQGTHRNVVGRVIGATRRRPPRGGGARRPPPARRRPTGQVRGHAGGRRRDRRAGPGEITVRHQEPVVLNGSLDRRPGLGRRVLANSKLPIVGRRDARNAQDFTTPVAVIVNALAHYPLFASLGQSRPPPPQPRGGAPPAPAGRS